MIFCLFNFFCSITLNGKRKATKIDVSPKVKLLIGDKSGHHLKKLAGISSNVISDPTKINGKTCRIEFLIVNIHWLFAIFCARGAKPLFKASMNLFIRMPPLHLIKLLI